MKKILLLFLIVVGWGKCNAQEKVPYFEKLIQIQSKQWDQILGMEILEDSSILIPVVFDSNWFKYKDKGHVIEHLTNGSLSYYWMKLTPDLEVDELIFIDHNVYGYPFYRDDDYLYISGHISPVKALHNAYVAKYTLEGEKVWSYETSNKSWTITLLNPETKNIFLVLGFKWSWNDGTITYRTNNDNVYDVVSILDSTGTMKWSKPIYGNSDFFVQSFGKDKKQRFCYYVEHECDTIKVGSQNFVKPEGAGEQEVLSWLIFEEDGTCSCRDFYARGNMYFFSPILTGDDCAYFSVLAKDGVFFGDDSVSYSGNQAYMYKLNKSGKIEWHTKLPKYLEKLEILPDNQGFVGSFQVSSGQTINILGEEYTNTSYADRANLAEQTFLILFDMDGNIKNYQYLGEGFYSFTLSISNNRINAFVNSKVRSSISWKGESYNETSYYCSFSYDLKQLDFMQISSELVKITSNRFGAYKYGDDRILGHFELWDDSITINDSVYYATLMWEGDDPECDDFIYMLNLGNNANTSDVARSVIAPLKIFPNPGTDYVKFEDVEKKGHLKLYKTNGELVINEDIDTSVPLDISRLESGIYIVVLRTSTKNYIQQLMKI